MIVLTGPAHLVTLQANGVVTVAVVDALPTTSEWAIRDGGPRYVDLTGQRIGLRADRAEPRLLGREFGEYVVTGGYDDLVILGRNNRRAFSLHPGCIVGSAVVEAVVPIRVDFTYPGEPALIAASPPMLTPQRLRFADGAGSLTTDLTDQLAYQQFTPGKTALILADPAPCEQRCPAIAEHCPTCLNWSCGTCPPIPFATDETWSVWP